MNDIETQAPATTVWGEPPRQLTLSTNELHVWCADLWRNDLCIDECMGVLSPDEKERADRLVNPGAQRRFVAARYVLRDILARYQGTEPSGLRFVYGPYGKPALETWCGDAKLYFNVSHSRELALIALTQSGEVGVDVESVRYDLAFRRLAKRYFSPLEIRALSQYADHSLARAFFSCWTRKEACLKASGVGLKSMLHEFSVSVAPEGPATLRWVKDTSSILASWSLHSLIPGAGYVGAVAAPALSNGNIQCWRWSNASAWRS